MYRKLSKIILLALIMQVFYTNSVFAQERIRATVALVFLNNAQTTYDEELSSRTLAALHRKVDGIYHVVDDGYYREIVKKAGITNLSSAERRELLDTARQTGEHIDYLVLAELAPFIPKEKITVFTYGKDMTATFFLKIIDGVNEKYLYNGKFIVKASDSTTDGLIGNKSVAMMALDSTLIQVGEVISFRLPLEPAGK